MFLCDLMYNFIDMNKEEKLIFEANARRVMELEKKLSELLDDNKRLSMDMESRDGTIAAMKRSSEESKARISELSKKSKELEKEIKEHEKKIQEQSDIIAIQEGTIREQKDTIDSVKAYLIENRLMERKLIDQLFGTSSAKTRNLVRQELKKDGQDAKAEPKKEKETPKGKRGRTKGKQNFDGWKAGCFLSEEGTVAGLDGFMKQPCPSCGSDEWVIVGYDTVEKISLVPQRIKRTYYRFPILMCRNCGEKIRTYSATDCFGRLACTTSLAGFLAMLSCGLFLPYKRIEDYFAYAGTPISRELITKYCMKTAGLLEGFVNRTLHDAMMKADVLHLDETVCCNLGEKEHTENRIWGATTGKHDRIQCTFYMYSDDRKHINLLGGEDGKGNVYSGLVSSDFHGAIVTDNYGAYNADFVHSLCWSHLRKYLFDYLKANGNPDSADYRDVRKLFDKANEIFALDRQFDPLTPEERVERRKKELKPLIEEYFAMAEEIYDPKVDSMKNRAIHYGLKDKELYMVLIGNAGIPLTNNRAEVSMRKYVMKRVSSMFSQSTDGIKATCTLLTLVQSARMNGLQPDAYVTYLLDHLRDLDDPNTAEGFLPWSEAIPEDVRLDPAEVAKAEAEIAKENKD